MKEKDKLRQSLADSEFERERLKDKIAKANKILNEEEKNCNEWESMSRLSLVKRLRECFSQEEINDCPQCIAHGNTCLPTKKE